MMAIIDELTDDLSWRESELASLKLLLKRRDITKTQREVLLRAAWAMLYAHYEGYCKYCLSVFYDEVQRRLSQCLHLPNRTKAYALDSHIKNIKNMPPFEAIGEIEKFSDYLRDNSPSFPEVDTKSNLWPNVMMDLLLDADISTSAISSNSAKLKTLVSRRNDIAHGKQSIINEVGYYLTYESAVYDVMYNLAYSIDERLTQPPYLP